MQGVNLCLKLLSAFLLKSYRNNLNFALSLFARFIFNSYPITLIFIHQHKINKTNKSH